MWRNHSPFIHLIKIIIMFSKAWFILRYWMGWIILFQLTRFVFMLANFAELKKAGWANFFGAAFWGLRMDMSMATYISLPVCILVMLSIFFKGLRNRVIYQGYSIVVLLLVLLLTTADIGLFKEWGFRIDSSFLKYLSNPTEAWASMSHLPLFSIIVALFAAFAILIFISSRWIKHLSKSLSQGSKKWVEVISIVLLIAISIIPLRGGLQLAPLNQSSVYFSTNNFSNLSAINAPWNFMHSLSHSNSNKNPFVFLGEAEAKRIVDSLHGNRSELLVQHAVKPNIILIVWESFTAKAVDLKKNGIEVTPGFNRLKNQGIYFSNIYATGDRTDKGIVGVLSGYPAQPTTSIVKTPSKAGSLPMIGRDYKAVGYHTAFYYGGELEFANMKAYLSGGGYDKFVSVFDFAAKDKNSKWGAHDGVVMEKLLADINQSKSPFFYTWLTLSSHEPFETPEAPVIKGSGIEEMFLNSLHYSDKVVTQFMEQARQQSWWNNTIIAIVADHGHPYPLADNKTNNFRIPMLLLGGLIDKPGVEDKVASQTDLAATLLAQSGLSHKNYPWSGNLLDTTVSGRAYFAFNNGFGFVNSSGYYVFDNVGRRVSEWNGVDSLGLRRAGQAVEQVSFGDYLKR
ncbi:MAG: LTA synthase family protein [Chitinophagaceae bacterium]|nr:MAG: LTA synthase family protein [Chitinophagaceae bacterium]